jgi:hypothetical protein
VRNHIIDFLVSRSKSFADQAAPDFASLHPGYLLECCH